MKPQNFEEKVVWYCLTGTYVLYFLGAQTIIIPIMAWILVLYLGKKLWEQTEDTPFKKKIVIHRGVWIWIVAMLIIQVALVVGLLDFNQGTVRIVKSSINFSARTWALFALFPLIGQLNIRPQLLSRAVCIVCLQSLIFIPICYLAAFLKLPNDLYTSPLEIAGFGKHFYVVALYRGNIDSQIRLNLFGCWATGTALVGNLYFYLACLESNKKWRWIGIIGAVAMVFVTVSRAGILSLLTIPFLTWFLVNITQPSIQITTGLGSFFAGLLGTQLVDWLKDFEEYFRSQRADSSRTREIIGELTIERWRNEASIWGRGTNEVGNKLTNGIPLGTHNTWSGLLLTHGIVGLIALAVPLMWTFIELLIKAQHSALAWAGLGITINLFIFTFADNIEGLTYISWPGLLMIGIALKTTDLVTNYNQKMREIKV